MRGSIALLSLAAITTMASHAGAHDVFQAIEQARRAGDLDEAGRLRNRVAAIVDPSQLDAPFRSLARPQARCHAESLVEAYQRLPDLPADAREPIRALLDPPTDLQHHVESDAPFPVRVSFADPALQPKAERILAAVATSYQREVIDFGFWPPLMEPGTEPYRIYLMDAGGAAGYTSPYLENPATPHADAYSYIVIDPVLDDIQLDATVAHEFNHACQVAMDVAEVRSFMENTASYIEIPVFPAGLPYAAALFPYFQSQPYRPLEYRVTAQTDGYEYGGALWPLFLVHHYADGDPVWIRQVWEGAMQQGGLNEPDYFDAIDALLADGGGVPAAALAFARQRFFVGSRADGQHLPGAEQWGGAEVWLAAQWTHAQLPILDQASDPDTRPQPNGCNYVMLTTDASSELPVKFSFAGAPAVAWHVALSTLVDGAETAFETMELEQAAGELSLPQQGVDEILMLICQATAASYDPDDKAWIGADYAYSIQLDIPPPQIDGVTPSQIAAGSVRVPVTIHGSGFVLGEGFEVALSGEQVAVEGAQLVSGDEVRAFVTVAPGAVLGPRDVTVINPGGAVATAAGALDVAAPDSPAEAGAASEGCGCRTAPASPRAPWWLAGVLGLWWRRRARKLWMSAAALLVVLCATSRASAQDYVASSSYPLRVYYTADVGEALALQALGFAENAWQAQVGQMGFGPIYTLDEANGIVEGLYIHLDPSAPYNHAEPIGDNPDTPYTDCTVKAVVATLSPVSYFELVVAHEMNHAFQMAADCGESPFAWENTTMAVTVLMFGQDPLFDEFLGTFQSYPHDGVDCLFFADQKKRYYHYGAALFQLFLEDRYGAYDGKLLSAFWNAAKQDGSVVSVGPSGNQLDVDNDPNLMDAIDAVLPVSFDEAFAEFGRWRYFVGSRDDGAHFTQGASWVGAEVRVDTALGLEALPVTAGVPATPVSEYGSAYVTLDLDGVAAETGLEVGFEGDPAMRWSADVLLVRADNSAEVRSIDVDAGVLSIDDDISAFDHAVLVVSNLSDGAHDPEAPSCSVGAMFSYSLALSDLALAPTVTAVDPASLAPGSTHQVWLSGSDFADGIVVAISGGGIEVGPASFVDAATVGVEVTVAADAEPGARDITVTNPNGMASTLAGAITITGDGEVSSGCGCAVPGQPAPDGRWWLLLLALGLASRGALAVNRRSS